MFVIRPAAPAEAALFAQHREIWLETETGSRAEGFYRRLGWGGDPGPEGGDVRLTKRRPMPETGGRTP